MLILRIPDLDNRKIIFYSGLIIDKYQFYYHLPSQNKVIHNRMSCHIAKTFIGLCAIFTYLAIFLQILYYFRCCIISGFYTFKASIIINILTFETKRLANSRLFVGEISSQASNNPSYSFIYEKPSSLRRFSGLYLPNFLLE